MSIKLVSLPGFKSDPFGHGGERRTAQIREILADNDLEAALFENQEGPVPGSKVDKFKVAFSLFKKLKLQRPTINLMIRLGSDYFRHLQDFTTTGACGVLLWERVHPDWYPLPFSAHAANWSVVALPHNLESLVPEQTSELSGRPSPEWLKEELSALRACNLVFTISREEQWLLRLHGMDADYLPYYPPRAAEEFFKRIQAARLNRSVKKDHKRFFLFGSYDNHPTRLGMIETVRELSSSCPASLELHIFGFGTEKLKEDIALPDTVNLHGAVGNDVLAELLLDADAVIAHQAPSTGCLTKISEMLIAGVPVLLNSNAARTWEGWPGVYVYESWQELRRLLSQDLTVQDSPQRPIEHEARFVAKVKSLLRVMA